VRQVALANRPGTDRAEVAAWLLACGGRVLRASGYLLFFLMLFVPTTYQPIKAALLALVVGGILVAGAVSARFPLAPGIAVGALGFSAFGLVSVYTGVLAGAPGALAMANVYVTWPLVYTVLVAGAGHDGVLRGLSRVLVLSAAAISAYSIIYVLWEAGWWPDALYYAVDQGQAIGFHGTYIEFNLYSISSLLFLVPYLVGALFVFPRDSAPVSRPLLWAALVVSLTTVLLTGRRALLVLVPMAPMFALMFRAWLTPAFKRSSRRMVRRAWWAALALGVGLVVVVTAFGALAPAGFADMVASGFRFNTDPVAMTRRDQFLALLAGWMEHPMLGSGHGAPAPGVIRSIETPWSYELTYVALLYHTGLVGLALYSAGVAWIFLASRRIARGGWPGAPGLVAALVGTASFLVANATNPYLEKYDYIWVLFLPIAFINRWMVERQRAGA